MMKKLGMVITCLVMILLLVSCANKRKDLVLSNFPSIQNELTEKDLIKAVGAPHEKSSSLSDVTQLYEKTTKKWTYPVVNQSCLRNQIGLWG